MKTMPVEELKTHFSEVLENVKHGEEIAVSYGRKKEKVAVIIPYSHYKQPAKRKLGVWDGKVSFKIHEDFKITEEEFLDYTVIRLTAC
jgi:prevent-host-death family protein